MADSHRIVFSAHHHNYSSNSLGSERCFLLALLIPFSFKYVAFYASSSPLTYFALEPTTWVRLSRLTPTLLQGRYADHSCGDEDKGMENQSPHFFFPYPAPLLLVLYF